MTTEHKVLSVVDVLRNDWLDMMMALKPSVDGKPLTEEYLREYMKVEARRAKPGRKAGSKTKKDDTPVGDCCSAVKHQRTKGDYDKARCSKPAGRDDGKGNLLCEDCGARWDTVSGNDIGGQICYGVGAAAKKAYGGDEWMGIYDVDCPPVFIGQASCVMDSGGKWDLRASMDKLSKDGDRRKGAFHMPQTPWSAPVTDEQQLQQWQGGEKKGISTDEQMDEDSTDAEAKPRAMFDLDGASYIKMTHDDSPICLYRAYGDSMPDPMVKGDATAYLIDDKVQWMDDEGETEHDEYVSSL